MSSYTRQTVPTAYTDLDAGPCSVLESLGSRVSFLPELGSTDCVASVLDSCRRVTGFDLGHA